jgi:hypothetical protein
MMEAFLAYLRDAQKAGQGAKDIAVLFDTMVNQNMINQRPMAAN